MEENTQPEDRRLGHSHNMKGMLDDDYTLYESGKIVHFFDKNIYPGGQNKTVEVSADRLSSKVKSEILDSAAPDDKAEVRRLLKMDQGSSTENTTDHES